MKNKSKILAATGSFLLASTFSFALWAQTTPAAPAAPAQKPAFDPFGMPMMLLAIFGVFYFLVIRPQQKQAKQRQAMIAAVKKGDQVVTVGGIHGRVTGAADSILTVEIADNCKVKVERSCVQSVITPKENGAAS